MKLFVSVVVHLFIYFLYLSSFTLISAQLFESWMLLMVRSECKVFWFHRQGKKETLDILLSITVMLFAIQLVPYFLPILQKYKRKFNTR